MLRTEQYLLGPEHPAFPTLVTLSNLAARVRNQALYRMRRQWEATGKWSEPGVRKQMRADEYEHYMAMPQKLARETSRAANRELLSYARGRKAGCRARLPRYMPHTGRAVLHFSASDQLSKPALREGVIKVGGVADPLVSIPRCGEVREVRVLPRKHHFVVEVVHRLKQKGTTKKGGHIAGLDVGIDNLAAVMIDKPGIDPLLVCGRQLKSTNQGFNKKKALMQSSLPAGVTWSAALEALSARRNRRVKALVHAASRTVVDYLVENGVSTLVVGWNTGFKSGPSDLGRVFNQRFRSLPLRTFVDQLHYKCADAGIEVIETEESYTSKTSVLDRELPYRRDQYSGKRVARGLFRSGDGREINADINGACQIVRKCKPEAFKWLADGVEATEVPTPVRVRAGGWPCAGKSAQKVSDARVRAR